LSAFQITKTENNSQTDLAEGGARLQSSPDSSTVTEIATTIPLVVCGDFDVNGKTTLRLKYEQAVVATVSSSLILSDRDAGKGQRDIHWSVIPITKSMTATLKDYSRTPGVTDSEGGTTVLVAADVSATETISINEDNYLSSCTDADPSVCTFSSNYWVTTRNPRCWVGNTTDPATYVTGTTNTTATIERTNAGSPFTLICKGQKQ
jgi:hypothetical protein